MIKRARNHFPFGLKKKVSKGSEDSNNISNTLSLLGLPQEDFSPEVEDEKSSRVLSELSPDFAEELRERMKQSLAPSDSSIDEMVEKSDTDPMDLTPSRMPTESPEGSDLEVELSPRDTIIDAPEDDTSSNTLKELGDKYLANENLEALKQNKLPEIIEKSPGQRRYRAEPPILRKIYEEGL